MLLRLTPSQTTLFVRALVVVALLFQCNFCSAQVMRKLESRSTHAKPALKWPKPSQLKLEIKKFESDAVTADWATRTSQLVDYLCTQTEVSQAEAAQVLQAIKQQADIVPSLIQRLTGTQSEALVSQLQRFQYRLNRRIQVWTNVIDQANSLRPKTADSSIRPVSLRRLPKDLDALEPGWQDYLAWDDLVNAARVMSADDKTKARLRGASQKFLARYHSPALTDEQREKFQPMFSPLILESVRAAATEDVDLNRLMVVIEALERGDSGKYMQALNTEYQKLLWSSDPTEQKLAAIIDSHWRNANVRIAINEALLNQLLPEIPVTTEPISDRVQGARVSGQSMIENQLRIGLIPNPSEISLGLQTTGHVTANTVAKRSGFIFRNRGFANFQVFKKLGFNRFGVTSEESMASSTANQRMVDLQGNYDRVPIFGRLTRSIAKKKAEEATPEAERIFKNRVESDAKKRVEEEVGQLVYKLRRDLHEHVLSRLISMDLEPETVQLSTTTERIIGRFRFAGRDQMAAFQPRPIDSESDLLTVQFHHSAINNLIERFELDGNEFNAASLGQRIQDVAGIPYQPAREGDDATFQFERHDAVRVDFTDGIASLVFNFRKFQIGKGKRWQKLQVTAKFKPTYIGTRIVLDRFEISPQSTSKSRKLRVGDHIAISGAFTAILEEQYAFDLMPNAVRESMPKLAFAIERLSLADGWCGVVFNNASNINRSVPVVSPEDVVPGTWSDQLGAFQPQCSKVETPRTARRIGTEDADAIR